MQRRPACRGPAALRRRAAVRRTDVVRNGDAALPAGPALCARQLPARPWRGDGVCSFAQLRTRPRKSAVCPAPDVPRPLRTKAAYVATFLGNCPMLWHGTNFRAELIPDDAEIGT